MVDRGCVKVPDSQGNIHKEVDELTLKNGLDMDIYRKKISSLHGKKSKGASGILRSP